MQLALRKDFGVSEFLYNFTSKYTRAAYKCDLDTYFSFWNTKGVVFSDPAQIDLKHLMVYREFLSSTYAPKTVSRKLAALKSLLNFFVDRGVIEHNPALTLKVKNSAVQNPTEAFSDSEVALMLGAANRETFSGNNHAMILYLLFYLGLRRSELVNLRLSDVYSVSNYLVLRVEGKGGKVRELPLPASFPEFFETFRLTYKRLSGKIIEHDDFLIQSSQVEKNSKPMNVSSVFRVVKKYAAEVGISKRVSPHSCRATLITKALEEGAIMTEVADMAGHSDISTTQIYWKRRQGFKNSPIHKINYGE